MRKRRANRTKTKKKSKAKAPPVGQTSNRRGIFIVSRGSASQQGRCSHRETSGSARKNDPLRRHCASPSPYPAAAGCAHTHAHEPDRNGELRRFLTARAEQSPAPTRPYQNPSVGVGLCSSPFLSVSEKSFHSGNAGCRSPAGQTQTRPFRARAGCACSFL